MFDDWYVLLLGLVVGVILLSLFPISKWASNLILKDIKEEEEKNADNNK